MVEPQEYCARSVEEHKYEKELEKRKELICLERFHVIPLLERGWLHSRKDNQIKHTETNSESARQEMPIHRTCVYPRPYVFHTHHTRSHSLIYNTGILTGTVVSTKMHRTLIIRREYLHFIPKYARYEKRHKNVAAHVSPAFRVEEGDQVTVGQCRPLSKTVRYCAPIG